MGIKRATKKPVTIEYVQWTGGNHREMFDFLFDGEIPPSQQMAANGKNFYIAHGKVHGGLMIKTLEGEHKASVGDMIIKGVAGEFYPCKPEIFYQTYNIEEE